ncbi:MAG: hypothetical protein NTY30_03685 [Candidatus Berkelbacteria bacterium]|nr:hypothetical protein [Candidatus Berkelbacteria bacterium]
MDGYNSFLHGDRLKKLYYKILFLLALVISIGIYIFFNFQPAVYQSSGKFAVFYLNKSDTTASGLQTNDDLTKSVAATITSRYFLEKVSQTSGVDFDSKMLDNNVDNIVKANVMTSSNIISVDFMNTNTDNLDKINAVFLNQLNSSKIISGSNSSITIQAIDPLYTLPNPTYPKPLTYALVSLAVIIFAGFLIIYTLSV